jgi:hypothetical protein
LWVLGHAREAAKNQGKSKNEWEAAHAAKVTHEILHVIDLILPQFLLHFSAISVVFLTS